MSSCSLCKVVARHQGIYTSHVRGERETILAAVAEALELGRAAGCPVEVSHNAPKWGAPEDASANLGLIEDARRGGLDATTDNDVHTDLAPRFSRALPQPVLDLDHDALIALLSDPGARAALRREVLEDTLPGAGYAGVVRHGRFDRVVVFHAGRHPELRGRSVADIAAERGADGFDTFLDLIVEEDDDLVGLFDYIEEKNIRALLQSPIAMISSDGLVMAPPEEHDDPSLYWPCSYGEYPGVLERYVREEPVLRLEEAIRKMTSFPAQRFRLFDRGALRPGLRRTSSCSTWTACATGRRTSIRTRSPSRTSRTPRPRASTGCSSTASRSSRMASTPARCRAGAAAPVACRRALDCQNVQTCTHPDVLHPRAVLGHRVESRR